MQPPRSPEHILVVDDDGRIRQMLARYFENEGYRVTGVGDGAAMRAQLETTKFDIVLLDLILPGGENGLELAREIRTRSSVPIMMLTGKDDVLDRIVGLELGADDYMAKPFHLREVLARVRTILRRRQPVAEEKTEPADEIIGFDDWRLDIARRHLQNPQGQSVELTTGDFDILTVFVHNPGRVLSRERLMDITRGRNLEAFDRTIDAQIVRLRKKLEADPARPQIIKSVRGVGYVFTAKTQVVS